MPTKDEEKRPANWTSKSLRGHTAMLCCFSNWRGWRKKRSSQSQSKVLLWNREGEPVLLITPAHKTTLSARTPALLHSFALALRWSPIPHTLSTQYFTPRQQSNIFRRSSMLPWNLWTVVIHVIYGITVTPVAWWVTSEMVYPDACLPACLPHRLQQSTVKPWPVK